MGGVAAGQIALSLLLLVLVLLVGAVIGLWCSVRIVQRAGYSGWWVLTALFPPLFLVMVFLAGRRGHRFQLVKVLVPPGFYSHLFLLL